MKAEEQARADIVEVGRRLWTRGFVASNDGNISVRLDDNRLITTPKNVSKGFMTPDMMVITDLDGKKIAGEPVRLLLENIDAEENPKYFLTSVARGFEIIKAVNHPQVRFCYDLFHEQISEGNLIEKLEKNIQHVGLIHVADVPGRHKPGTGEINFANIFRKLRDLRYDHVVAMEFLPIGDPVEELRAAREMALRD